MRVIVFSPPKHRALALVSEPKLLRLPFKHLITIGGFEEYTAEETSLTLFKTLSKRDPSRAGGQIAGDWIVCAILLVLNTS